MRMPHRPNPIGVTLCKLDSVRRTQKNKKLTATLEISGLDLVDGTPVLDIKPFVPHYDSVQNIKTHHHHHHDDDEEVRVPHWVSSGLARRRSVSFTQRAQNELEQIILFSHDDGNKSPLQFFGLPRDDSPAEALYNATQCIIEVLGVDVRSTYQTGKARKGKSQAERAKRLSDITTTAATLPVDHDTAKEQEKQWCTQQLDNLLIKYTVQEPQQLKEENTNDNTENKVDDAAKGSGSTDSVLVQSILLIQHGKTNEQEKLSPLNASTVNETKVVSSTSMDIIQAISEQNKIVLKEEILDTADEAALITPDDDDDANDQQTTDIIINDNNNETLQDEATPLNDDVNTKDEVETKQDDIMLNVTNDSETKNVPLEMDDHASNDGPSKEEAALDDSNMDIQDKQEQPEQEEAQDDTILNKEQLISEEELTAEESTDDVHDDDNANDISDNAEQEQSAETSAVVQTDEDHSSTIKEEKTSLPLLQDNSEDTLNEPTGTLSDNDLIETSATEESQQQQQQHIEASSSTSSSSKNIQQARRSLRHPKVNNGSKENLNINDTNNDTESSSTSKFSPEEEHEFKALKQYWMSAATKNTPSGVTPIKSTSKSKRLQKYFVA
eukprot:14641929-Ditylum_brightwellii.AAC.1